MELKLDYKSLGIILWLYIAFWALILAGWVQNLVKFISIVGHPIDAQWIARIVGIPVVILGAIYGWF
jgi:hypothetical protein